MSDSNLIEIFSSIQGEGKYVGCRQIFIRLSDCNLRCAYCDTDFRRADYCNVETAAGSMRFTKIKNPVNVDSVVEIIKKFISEVPTHSVSFTGGEPLLHCGFIREISEGIKNFGVKIFIETNGTLVDELKKILEVANIISMDIKFPSVVGENLFNKHKKFLEVAKQKDCYVKAVISDETTLEEFDAAINLISKVAPETLLVLQPVTPVGKVQVASAEKILQLQARALKKLSDVRVIPQTHKQIKIL